MKPYFERYDEDNMKNPEFEKAYKEALKEISVVDNCVHEWEQFEDRGDHGTGRTYWICRRCSATRW